MAAPTVGPNPGTMFTTPGGNPTCRKTKMAPEEEDRPVWATNQCIGPEGRGCVMSPHKAASPQGIRAQVIHTFPRTSTRQLHLGADLHPGANSAPRKVHWLPGLQEGLPPEAQEQVHHEATRWQWPSCSIAPMCMCVRVWERQCKSTSELYVGVSACMYMNVWKCMWICVCPYMRVWTSVCVHTYVYVSVTVYILESMGVWLYMDISVKACMFLCLYMSMWVCVCKCVHMCTYMWTWACVHVCTSVSVHTSVLHEREWVHVCVHKHECVD